VSVVRMEYFRDVEPLSPPPRVRIHVLRGLRDAGVEVSAFVAPVFPDALAELEETLRLLRREGVPVGHVELLNPHKNPLLRESRHYGRWVALTRRPEVLKKALGIVSRYYPKTQVLTHGWGD